MFAPASNEDRSVAREARRGAPDLTRDSAGLCFHCGLPLPQPAFPVTLDGVSRDTCCRGCQAVAETIIAHGLASYYRHRSALPATPEAPEKTLRGLGLYDLPGIQRVAVRDVPGRCDEKEAALLIEGITCAACVWLIEQRVMRLGGVASIAVNHATRRATVRWDARRTSLSEILSVVAQIGYTAQPYDPQRSDMSLRRERRTLLLRLFVAGFGMMQVMMYAVPAYLADGAMTADIEQLLRLASFILTTPVALWAAWPFYEGAWRDVRNRRWGMDVPVSIGVLSAYLASANATVQGSGDVYFDSVSMFVFLLLAARFLELGARAKAAREQERLVRLTPAGADRLAAFPESDVVEQVPTATLRAGDYVLVRPGARIPADGVVAAGRSTVDEAMLTGESRPVEKNAGDALTAGATNLDSPLTLRVERVGEETCVAGIMRLMDRAQSEKPRITLLADKMAQRFVAVLLLLTAIAAAAWYVIDPARALWIAIAILVVSCPCALSLATPAALTAAMGAFYRCGVLVTHGHAIETLTRATHFVFDKTGTLTTGRMTLRRVVPLGAIDSDGCLQLAAALERQSEHPVARAVAVAARHLPALVASEVLNTPGAGIEGSVDGRRVRIGTPAFVAEMAHSPAPRVPDTASADEVIVAMGDAQGWLGMFAFADALRPDARRAVDLLQEAGKTVCLLSGDRSASVKEIAEQLGIRVWRAEATPAAKRAFVQTLQREGAVVAMAGDGVNDAPVLAQAQISLALAAGTELAQSTADMILMSERLAPLIDAVSIAQDAMNVIRQNFVWAIGYNALAVPLAIAGYVTPLAAAAGMSLSSLLVVLNALRLLRPLRGERSARSQRDAANCLVRA